MQLTFTRETGDTTIVDTGAITCGAECTDECEPMADVGLPYSATRIVTDDTWTVTAVVTQQMVSDEITPCEAGQTMVTVAIRLVTDCTGEEDDAECVFEETPGHCFNEVCFVSDCSGVEDLTACSQSVVGIGLDYNYACVDGACMGAVGNCTDPSDAGSPCWLSEDPPEFGLCEATVCGN